MTAQKEFDALRDCLAELQTDITVAKYRRKSLQKDRDSLDRQVRAYESYEPYKRVKMEPILREPGIWHVHPPRVWYPPTDSDSDPAHPAEQSSDAFLDRMLDCSVNDAAYFLVGSHLSAWVWVFNSVGAGVGHGFAVAGRGVSGFGKWFKGLDGSDGSW